MPDELLSLKQAAARLGVNASTMARYIKARLLPAYCINSSKRGRAEYRIRASDLDAFLESRKL